MEKKKVVFLTTFLALILISSLVSAQWYGDFESASNQIIDWIKQIFGPFLEALIGESAFNEHFFARVLLLILIYAIVLTVLKKIELFSKNTFVCVLIAAIVSILGVRYLSETNLISWILLPYGTFFIAIAVFLPFLIYFFFVHTSVNSSIGRRLAWILFAAVFLGLWISRLRETGSFDLKNLGTANWMYLLGIAGVAISFFFDREIQKYFGLHAIAKWKRKADEAEITRLQAEYQNIANVDTPQAKRRREDIVKRSKSLGASVS